MAEPTSKLRETTLAILKAYESMEIERIMSFRTEECIQIIGPSSLERPMMNNVIYQAFFTAVSARLSNFQLTIKEIIEDPAANKTVVYAQSVADTAAGRQTYWNEYFIIFEFDESQEKIKRMLEFVDSAKSKEQSQVLRGE